jgi:hypothetical protein
MSTERKFIIVADTDGAWYIRRVKWTIDDVERGLMVYECDAPVGKVFRSGEKALAALRKANAPRATRPSPRRKKSA